MFRERLQQKEILQIILLVANILAYIFSLWVQCKFGQAYKAVELTGKYAVGHREFHTRINGSIHTRINGNSISVYYPVSRSVAHANRDKQKLYIDDKDQAGAIRSQEAVIAWYMNIGKTKFINTFKKTQFLKYLRIQAYHDLPLADELSTAPLIPIIFSHGLTGNRMFYQLMGQEFASHGYIVFIIDHLDGTNLKTTSKLGKNHVFDTKKPYFMLDFKLMTEEV